MDYLSHIVVLLVFGLALTSSATLVVRSLSHLSRLVGLSRFSISFLVLGMFTSLPEMFVAYRSAVGGVAQLSVGNLIGGQILMLSLVMGVSALVYGKIVLNHGMTFYEIVLSSIVVVAPVVVLWDGGLTRVEGACLIGMYLLQALLLKKEGSVTPEIVKKQATTVFKSVSLLLIGLAIMALSSYFMVESAKAIIALFHIPALVFGLLLLSLGTNLPEFSLAFHAAKSKTKSIAFGDYLGSAAANTAILGVLGLFAPFHVIQSAKLLFSLVLLFAVTLFFVWALSSHKNITRKEGLGLLVFYGMFIVFEFLGGP